MRIHQKQSFLEIMKQITSKLLAIEKNFSYFNYRLTSIEGNLINWICSEKYKKNAD